MKSILIVGASIVLILYVIMYIADHQFWPESTGQKIKNVLLILFALYLSYNLTSIYLLKNEKEENALAYRVASTGKKIYISIMDHIQPFQQEFLLWLAVAAGLAVLGLLLVGIPGYFFLEIPAWLGMVNRIEGDNAWPSAILMSILWPFFLPAGVLVKQYLIRHGQAAWGLTGWIGTVVGGIALLVALIYWMSRKSI